jgi:hypothetical protein
MGAVVPGASSSGLAEDTRRASEPKRDGRALGRTGLRGNQL